MSTGKGLPVAVTASRNPRSQALCGVPSEVWYPGRTHRVRVEDAGPQEVFVTRAGDFVTRAGELAGTGGVFMTRA
eukprot:8930223-Pyramimonas_sp.AAC.1